MISSKYIMIAGGVVAAILAVVGYRALQNKIHQSAETKMVQESVDSTRAGSSQTSSPVSSIKAEGTGNYRVETLPLRQSQKTSAMPPLDRAAVFPASFSAEARNLMSDKITATVAALKKDPHATNEWLNLAIFRKQIDDFEGARDIWVFLAAANPDEALLFANLANLYAFELKDPARAEENFIKALEKAPSDGVVYRQAYEFYRFVKKDDAKAKEILGKGIAQTSAADLKYLLDHYDEQR